VRSDCNSASRQAQSASRLFGWHLGTVVKRGASSAHMRLDSAAPKRFPPCRR
jgi:hypothetical protein